MAAEHCKYMQSEQLGVWTTVTLPDGKQVQVKKFRGRRGLRIDFWHPSIEKFQYNGPCLIDESLNNLQQYDFAPGSGVTTGVCTRCKRKVVTKLI